MLKSEITYLLKSRKTILVSFFMFIVPMIDLIVNWYDNFYDYLVNKEYYSNGLDYSDVLHPAKAAFLSGSSSGHIAQMILLWILPIYLMVIYCDKVIYEKNSNYFPTIFVREKSDKIIKTKYLVSFILPFAISIISLILNYIFAIIIFHKGSSFQGMEEFAASHNSHWLIRFSIKYPYEVYFLYIVVYALVAGMCGIICQTIALLFDKYKLAYTVAFVFWFIALGNPYSITYLIQPFIEYGIEYIVWIVMVYVFITICAYIYGTRYFTKKDVM